MALIESFLFFNELDILEGRLEYLYDHVDWFLIVESITTFSGIQKPLRFLENITRYKKYLDKILYCPYYSTKEDSNNPWAMEGYQRNYIGQYARFFKDDDYLLISDIDEIPNKAILPIAIDNFNQYKVPIVLEQHLFYYNFKKTFCDKWYGSILVNVKTLKDQTPSEIRNKRQSLPNVSNGGWHLSYWGSVEDIKIKIESYSHQELNMPIYTNIENITNSVKNNSDLFHRHDMQLIDVDYDTIPHDIKRIFGKYCKIY